MAANIARRDSRRGQSLVEVALLMPLLLMLTVLLVDIGRSFYYREAITNAARQMVRSAAQPSAKTTGNTYCAGGGVASSNLPSASSDTATDIFPTIVNTAALESSSDGTKTGSALNNTTHQTTVSITWHCLAGAAITNTTKTSTDPANPGSDAITVHVDYSFQLLTPYAGNLINGGSQVIHIKIDETGRVEY